MTNGIDVSKHNGKIDWAKVAKQIDFAILRAGYGKLESQKDERFEENYKGAEKQKIPIGAYWYSYAKSAAEAKSEVLACLAALGGKGLDLPLYFDIEEADVLKLGKTRVSAIARAFLSGAETAGYKAGIYASKSTMETLIADDIKEQYSVWVAHVGKGGAALSKTSYKGELDIWQYSWKGKIDGISGDVDLDHCYCTIGSAKTEKPTENKKTVSELAAEVIAGKWGNGEDRKKKLIAAGYSYADVQAEVNKIIGKSTRTATHTVRQGDTLSALAYRYGTDAMAIVKQNKQKYPRISPNYIVVGWELKV